MSKGYTFGVLLVLAGGFFLSLAGVLLRHVESASGWQILFYRSLSFSVTLFIILAIRYRGATVRAFRSVDTRGIMAATALGLGSVCYVFAILNTTVANVVFIIGASPLLTAAVVWCVLRERVSPISLTAMRRLSSCPDFRATNRP